MTVLLGASFGCATSRVIDIDVDGIEKAMVAHQSEISACNPSRKPGRVAVRFTIDASGEVTDGSVEESDLQAPETETCILDTVRNIRFPASKGPPAHINYPFRFGAAPQSKN
jgi:TonB family protein